MNLAIFVLSLLPLVCGPGLVSAQTFGGPDADEHMRESQKLTAAARQLHNQAAQSHEKNRFRVLLDPGHTPEHPGAISSQGRAERGYNQNIAGMLLKRLAGDGDIEVSLTNGPQDTVENADRAKLANELGVDVFLSIHHDSVQEIYLSTWTFEGAERRYCDRFHGYSVLVADDKPKPLAEKSYLLADILARKMLERSFTPTLHHAEPIAGENRKLLDRAKGIYERNDLAVFRPNQRPAVLIECGVIVNREEERELQDPAAQARIVEALYDAVREYKSKLSTAAVPTR